MNNFDWVQQILTDLTANEATQPIEKYEAVVDAKCELALQRIYNNIDRRAEQYRKTLDLMAEMRWLSCMMVTQRYVPYLTFAQFQALVDSKKPYHIIPTTRNGL